MTILDRYIIRTVLGGTFLAMFVLLSLIVFLAFVEELGDLGKGSYTLWEITKYILLTVPRRAFELIPTATLLGSLLGLGTMANTNELIIMRASGLSKTRIVISAMKAGGVIILFSFLLGEYIAPYTETQAQSLRVKAHTEKIAMGAEYGFWSRDNLTFINIRNVLAGAKLRDVYIYEFDEKRRLRVSTHAKTAYHDKGSWILEEIEQSYVSHEGVKSLKLAKAKWESLLDPGLMRFVVVEPESLSIQGLYRYASYLDDNAQDSHRYRLAMWGKITSPLDIALLLMLSIPFVLGSMRSVSVGQRILVGTLLGIVYFLIDKASSHVGLVYNVTPIIAVFAPIILFSGLAYIMLKKTY
jgi:lipopolysaccharide export system permease protein